MAIAINDIDNFNMILIPHFIDGDGDQLDPCFAAFKRIMQIIAPSEDSDKFISNLQLIGKASIKIDWMWI